jgi:pimeloyl-ACP methyl ester carboxylesterase
MAPVARTLAPPWGVLEPLQTAVSVQGQVEELRAILEGHGALPITLIGFSWGAWLGYMVAACHPTLVRKLILVGSGPFQEEYAAQLAQTRAARLSQEERDEFQRLLCALSVPTQEDADAQLARLGDLASRCDTYDPLPTEDRSSDSVGSRGALFQQVWGEAAALRRSGELIAMAERIRCPVVAIHGDYDPHPAEGVRAPLSRALERFRFILLARCGHRPWIEGQAREAFFRILRSELESRT